MLITDQRIRVDQKMLENAGLFKNGKLGIPFSASQLNPITWKPLDWELTDQDFDKIEDYFLNLKAIND